jgi:hypothetical protein
MNQGQKSLQYVIKLIAHCYRKHLLFCDAPPKCSAHIDHLQESNLQRNTFFINALHYK